MALTKSKKVELIDSYTNAIKNSKSAVYVSYKGLSVGKQEELRKKLFAEKMNYTVVKKSLWDRAATANKISGDTPAVSAEMAVVWGDDLLAPARIANDFAKLNKKSVAILGGIFDGGFKDAASMMKIATIPTREVLLSQLAYLLKSPMQRIAIAVSEVAKTK
jgi:large subunit ribosomal protein L10